MPPTLNQVHIDRALTSLAIAFREQKHAVGDAVFPFFKTDNETDIIWKLDKKIVAPAHASATPTGDQSIRAEDGTSRPAAGWVPTQDNFRVEEYARHHVLFDRVVAKADAPLNLRANAVKMLTQILIQEREHRAVTLASTAANWATTSAASAAWNVAGTNTILDVDTAKKAIRKATLGAAEPSQMKVLMSWERFLDVRQVNTDIKERLKYTTGLTGRVMTPAMLAAYWDVGEVVIAGAYFDTAGELLTENLAQFWPDNKVLVFWQEPPSIQYLGAGLTFTTKGGGTQVRTWRDEARKGEVIEVEMYADEKILNTGAGYVLTGT